MKKKLESAAILGIVIIFVGVVVYLNSSVWRECHSKNSFMFCMSVLK